MTHVPYGSGLESLVPSGPSQSFLVPSSAYPTIQAAVDAAAIAGGGQVLVAGGTFTENVTLDDAVPISISSQGTPGQNQVIVNGNITVTATASVEIGGLTVNGTIDYNAGAAVSSQFQNLTVNGRLLCQTGGLRTFLCVFRSSVAGVSAVDVSGGALNAQYCTIANSVNSDVSWTVSNGNVIATDNTVIGQVITSNNGVFQSFSGSYLTSVVSNLEHNAVAGAVMRLVNSSHTVLTPGVDVVTGAGAFFYDNLDYVSTGNTLAATLNSGQGPFPVVGSSAPAFVPTPLIVAGTHLALRWQRVLYDPSAGGMQVTAPANPIAGQRFGVRNVTTDVTAITISGGANSIEDPGTPGTFVASYVSTTAGFGAEYEFNLSTGWTLVALIP